MHGLVALVPLEPRKLEAGVKSIFFDDAGHVPFISVATASIHGSNVSKPDFIVSGPHGRGLAIWRFEGAQLDDSNLKKDPFNYDRSPIAVNETDMTKLRWVPFLDDIVGTYEAADPQELQTIQADEATADWKLGKLEAHFFSDVNTKQQWKIGNRKAPIADGVRLRLNLIRPGDPVRLLIKRGGTDEVIPLHGGSTVQFSTFPAEVLQLSNTMPHFKHLYRLRTSKAGDEPEGLFMDPTPDPARCAPLIVPVEPYEPPPSVQP